MPVNLFHDEQAARAEAAPTIAQNKAREERDRRERARPKAEAETDKHVDAVNRHARRADSAQSKRDELRERNREAVKDNADLDTGNPIQDVSQHLAIAVIPAAYILDVLLFKNFVSYMLASSQNESNLTPALLIVSAAVVLVEVFLATQLYGALRDARTWRNPAVIAWGVLAVVFMLGCSLVTGATLIANEGASSMWDLNVWQFGLLIPAVMIAAIPHAMLLFSGRAGYFGKALLYKNIRRGRIRFLDRLYAYHADKAVAHFRKFKRRANNYYHTYRHNPWSDPFIFTDAARRIVNERLRTEAIPSVSAYRGNGFPSLFNQPPSPSGVRQQGRGDL